MKIQCKYCAAHLNVRDDLRGKKGQCPKCRADLHLVPTPSQTDELMSLDLSDAAMQQEMVEAPGPTDGELEDLEAFEASSVSVSERKQKKKAKRKEPHSGEAAEEEEIKKKRRRSKYSLVRLVTGVFDGPFWRSAAEHLLFMTLALAVFGAIAGFLVGLVRSAVVAALMFNLIGIPSMLFAYFVLCYPASCFWKIVVGSTSGGDDISEWPDSSVGEWVFDLVVVGYMVVMSLFISAGIAKFREVAIPGQVPSEQYWQVLGSVTETNSIVDLQKLLGKDLQKAIEKNRPNLTEVESARPVIDPGPAWWTAFGAMIFVFPIVVISCLDETTPLIVPWSPRLWMSFVKKAPAWLVSIPLLALLMSIAVVVFILGANHAPFLTFTLCSPVAAAGLIVYGRLLGRLGWHISRT